MKTLGQCSAKLNSLPDVAALNAPREGATQRKRRRRRRAIGRDDDQVLAVNSSIHYEPG